MQFDILDTIKGPKGSAQVCREFMTVTVREDRTLIRKMVAGNYFAQMTGTECVTPFNWGMGGPHRFGGVHDAVRLAMLLTGADLLEADRLVLGLVHDPETRDAAYLLIRDVTVSSFDDREMTGSVADSIDARFPTGTIVTGRNFDTPVPLVWTPIWGMTTDDPV